MTSITKDDGSAAQLGWKCLIFILIALLLASCSDDSYNKLSENQCKDWREISGFMWTGFPPGYHSFSKVVCIVSEREAKAP